MLRSFLRLGYAVMLSDVVSRIAAALCDIVTVQK